MKMKSQRESQRLDGAGPQLIADLRTDDFELRHLGAGIDGLMSCFELRADRGFTLRGSGGRRMTTSREEPKFCTCGSRKPAAASFDAQRRPHWRPGRK